MSLWFPMLPVEAFRRRNAGSHDARAVLIVRSIGSRRIVSACCDRALAAGARPGMTVADARGVFPPDTVVVVPDDESRTAAALAALGRWAHRFSPRVALDPPDGLLLDITGCARTLGGEESIRADACAALERFNIRARCVIAPTYACAAAVARYGHATLVTETGLREAADPLPVAALGLDAKQIAALAEVGLDRVGQLVDIPRSVLPARFGDDLLLRLDRLLGRAMETINPIRPEEPVRAGLVFDGPTHRWESIEAIVRSLLDELCERMARRDRGVLRLVMTLARSDLPPVTLAFAVSSPSHDAGHLWSLIRPRLERTHLGFGVEGIDLLAERCAMIGHTQRHAWSADEQAIAEREAAARLVDGLTNRLGRGRVLRAQLQESHRPERAVAWTPAVDEPAAHGTHRPAPPPPLPRPTILLDRPEPAEVVALTPDGPVHRVSWRGAVAVVMTCLGPERIGPEWWRVAKSHARTRDYFALQTEDGSWLWVYRQVGAGDWFVHGMWG